MNHIKTVVLIGSPKTGASTSRALAEHLVVRLREGGGDVRTYHIHESIDDPSSWREVLDGCRDADLLVVSAPLYIDSLPSEVITWMETMGEGGTDITKVKRFLAVLQCSHPDVDQTSVAMDILKNFSDRQGYEWIGAMRMPMGPAINGKALSDAKGAARHATKALDLIASALVKGEEVPVEAFAEMHTRPMPVFLYLMMANRSFKRRAKENGARYMLMERPYQF